MKILLSTDGSPCSQEAVKEITRRPWPDDTQVEVLSVAHTKYPDIPDPLLIAYPGRLDALEEKRKAAQKIVETATATLQENKQLKVSTKVLEGPPKKIIVDEAQEWGADLIVIGCHGYGPIKRFLLGSVSQAVALHAPCSVEIVRSHPVMPDETNA